MNIRCLLIALSLALVWSSSRSYAQLAVPAEKPLVGARMPSLSPDGQQLAFAYRGDLWIAPSKGGRATPLTRHVEMDAYPLFSPDGQWIAFASRRNGNWDIFVMPAQGGAAQQLTWHSGADTPAGWSGDCKSLLFSARRDGENYTLYSLDLATLRPSVVCEDYATINSASFSPDNQAVAYGRYGFTWTRPRYHGASAAQIWWLDLTTQCRHAVTTNGFQHLWTRFMPDGQHLLTVTCREVTPSAGGIHQPTPPIQDNPLRTPNLWLLDRNGTARQLTTFTGGAVRAPAVAAKSGDIAFEHNGDLYCLRSGKKTPEKIELFAALDEKENARRGERLNNGVTEAEPSPDGKTVSFGLRGDIWTIAVTKPKGIAARSAEFARRLTDWAGDDSDFVWARDGKKLYFTSDREFNTRLYELELDSLQVKALWTRPEDAVTPHLSPDGRELAFWVTGKEGGLYLLTLTNAETRRLVHIPGPQWHGMGGGEYAWSPDGQWIAFTRRDETSAWNIFIVPTAGGKPVNVTALYAHHGQPEWSPDGKYLFFQSNRDGFGLYALPLKPESVRPDDADLKFEKSTNQVKVEIVFDDAARRIRRISTQTPQADLTVTPDGQIIFLADGDVWSLSYDGKESKRLTSGGGKSALRLTRDGKKAFFMQNGELWNMPLDGKPPEKITFTAEWERDVRAERLAAFTQFWRSYQRGFYDSGFHGRNWEKVRGRYEPLLDSTETGEEFATVLQMMVGELEASHSEVSPAPSPTPSPTTPHLGFSFDYRHPGPGIRIARVLPVAPGSFDKTRLRAGEYVLAINGRDVTLDEKLYQIINDKQGRDFEFLISTNTERAHARTVKYKVLTQDEWRDLAYQNRIERLRKYVADRSRDRVGYLHLAAMGSNNRVDFERAAYARVVGKDALIIDVRFNNGGNIADSLIDWLERKPHGYLRHRDGETLLSPHQVWTKQIVVLINEHSYSNAEIFASAIRTRRLARLVGMPTPGYVIWTENFRLVDGTGARMPQSGTYRLDGSPLENQGEEPDVRVPLSPDDWLAGRDPQMDKALELLGVPPARR